MNAPERERILITKSRGHKEISHQSGLNDYILGDDDDDDDLGRTHGGDAFDCAHMAKKHDVRRAFSFGEIIITTAELCFPNEGRRGEKLLIRCLSAPE